MEPLIRAFIDPSEEILMVGCGNAPFSGQMRDIGYTRQVNIDNCPGVVEQQKVREPDMVWDLGDVREMEYETGRFDVVFDKGLLDNLQCYLEAEEVCAAGLKDMYRVLKPGGKFLLLSCHSPEELGGIMENSGCDWITQVPT